MTGTNRNGDVMGYEPMDFWRGLVLAVGVGAMLWAIIGGIVWGLTR